MAERIEEYRYYSSSVGDVRPLSIGQLTLRIATFHKVAKKARNVATAAAETPRLGKRLR